MDFFSFRDRVVQPRNSPPAPDAAGAHSQQSILTVSQLTSRIQQALNQGLPATVAVRGEVSNYRHHSTSGHLYFTLKDANACIDCVMFRSDAARLKFEPQDGMELIASGHVDVYPQRGRYQLYVSRAEPVGRGALELAFRQLHARLQAEGLFAPERKKPLPFYPQHIALVTSTQTAAVHDMLKVLRRFPFVHVMIYHVPVQGEGAAQKIAEAIADLNRHARELGGVDLILLGRGGGSLEDLWPFNEEIVVRAVASSRIPVITGIGHEIDVTIADLASDYHAHTPTEAAQVAMSHWRNARDSLENAGIRLRRELRSRLQQARQQLEKLQLHELFRRPLHHIERWRQRLDDCLHSLALAMGTRLRRAHGQLGLLFSRLQRRSPQVILALYRERLAALSGNLNRGVREALRRCRCEVEAKAAHLQAVGPQQVLARGYSITTLKKTGQIIRSAAQVHPGDHLLTRLADGTIESETLDSAQLQLFE